MIVVSVLHSSLLQLQHPLPISPAPKFPCAGSVDDLDLRAQERLRIQIIRAYLLAATTRVPFMPASKCPATRHP
jgi:hypothetical protein